MKRKTLATLLCFGLTISFAFAQNVEFKRSNFKDQIEEYKKASKALKDGEYFYTLAYPNYRQALKNFLTAYEFNPNNAKLNYMIGDSYINSLEKTKAVKYFEKAYELDPDLDPDIKYMLGWSHHVHEDWLEAIEWYEKYKEQVYAKAKDSSDVADEVDMIEKRIVECAFGIHYSKKPVDIIIENVGNKINTEFPEYGVLINADETVMMFTSQRPEGVPEEYAKRGVFREDIYEAVRKSEDSEWKKSFILDSINAPMRHDATIALSPDGQTLLVYRDDDGDGNIYISELKGKDWTKPKKLPETINSEFHESSASFSYDMNTIYFVSDREEGSYGKHDIWYSNWDEENQTWGPAKNMGGVINTEYGEQGVFMHPDGVSMYFASEGHSSMGGFDIFKSELIEGKWTEPVNMGYPINGADDDLLLVISADGDHGYYSSYGEDSKGLEDIYRITFKEHKEEHLTVLKGHILDAVTLKPVEAEIEIIDLDSNKTIHTFHSNSETGQYLISLPSGRDYAIEIDEKDHVFHSEHFDIPITEGFHQITKDIYLKNIAVGSEIVLKNIFFETASYELKDKSKAELDRLVKFLNEVPNVTIEISGHTDNVGSRKSNVKLSKNRAKSVVQYLVGHGIDPKRLDYKGYGFDRPIASNDDDLGRSLNRRTAFKITGNDFEQ